MLFIEILLLISLTVVAMICHG